MPTRVTHGIEITVERRPIGKWARRAGKALGVAGGGFLSGALALAYYVAHSITAPTATTPFDAFTFMPVERPVLAVWLIRAAVKQIPPHG